MFNITHIAHFLGIDDLIDICCGCIARMIRGKSVEEVRANFNIPTETSDECIKWFFGLA